MMHRLGPHRQAHTRQQGQQQCAASQYPAFAAPADWSGECIPTERPMRTPRVEMRMSALRLAADGLTTHMMRDGGAARTELHRRDFQQRLRRGARTIAIS